MAELDGVYVFRLWSAQLVAPSEVLSRPSIEGGYGGIVSPIKQTGKIRHNVDKQS